MEINLDDQSEDRASWKRVVYVYQGLELGANMDGVLENRTSWNCKVWQDGNKELWTVREDDKPL